MDNSLPNTPSDQSSFDPQQMTQQIASSYVDDYLPPMQTSGPAPVASSPEPTFTPTPEPVQMPVQTQVSTPAPTFTQEQTVVAEPAPTVVSQPPVELSSTPQYPDSVHQDMVATTDLMVEPVAPLMKVEEPLPPAVQEEVPQLVEQPVPPSVEKTLDEVLADESSVVPQPVASAAPSANSDEMTDEKDEEDDEDEEDEKSQTLEDQNIFKMLNIEAAREDEKEMFLDELQQIIWEDFLDHDIELLLTEDELVEFRKIEEKKELNEEDRQSEMVEFLEKLIPDLEKIMLEKALELKQEMFLERIVLMKKQFAENAEKLATIESVEQLQKSDQWFDAVEMLNAVDA